MKAPKIIRPTTANHPIAFTRTPYPPIEPNTAQPELTLILMGANDDETMDADAGRARMGRGGAGRRDGGEPCRAGWRGGWWWRRRDAVDAERKRAEL